MLNVFSIWACDETFKVIFFKLSFNEESQNIIEFLELIRTCFSLITFLVLSVTILPTLRRLCSSSG